MNDSKDSKDLHGKELPENDRAPVDPAASMSLLTQLLANPLDAGYTEYAGHEAKQYWWQRVLVLLFALGLGFASVTAITSLRTASAHDVVNDLRDRAQSQQRIVGSLQDDVQSLSSRLDTATGEQGGASSLDTGLLVANSLAPVSGPGLVVTLKDSESAAALSKSGRGRVRDLDLNVVVNALWGAGAEAIAINGIRVGPGTFIRTAGSVILVNITPVQSPYLVSAIGDANALSVALVRDQTGDFLSSAQSINGITLSTAGNSTLDLPALDLRTTREAKPLETGKGD